MNLDSKEIKLKIIENKLILVQRHLNVNFCTCYDVMFSQQNALKSSLPVKGSTSEPVKASLAEQRLSTEQSMKNSAEAYLKGSWDVSTCREVHAYE